MTALPDGLLTWAGEPGPAKLLDAVRTRARRGQRTESGSLSTLALSGVDRRQIGRLLGTQWEVSCRPPRLQDLAACLAEHALTVRGLVELVDGRPIEPDSERRRARATAAETEVSAVVATLIAGGVDEGDARAWLSDPGLPVAGEGALAELAAEVAAVWQALPRRPAKTRLAQLAAVTMRDAHALDADRLLGRAVARLIARVHGLQRPRRAGAVWRAAWARVGVRCDGVSSRVLVLNLPLRGAAPAVAWCAAANGEPLWLTLRSLVGSWQARPETVYVCENATVVEAAADALGVRCPPLVCTDGVASGAALDLLGGLADAGCEVRYRADIDPAGFVIADQILGVVPTAIPWRFGVSTYLAAIGHGPSSEALTSLREAPTSLREAPTSLREAYATHGVDVHEERLLDDLIADLTTAPRLRYSCPDH